jgi:hypothetical protein
MKEPFGNGAGVLEAAAAYTLNDPPGSRVEKLDPKRWNGVAHRVFHEAQLQASAIRNGADLYSIGLLREQEQTHISKDEEVLRVVLAASAILIVLFWHGCLVGEPQ